jgi:hypothetical protein
VGSLFEGGRISDAQVVFIESHAAAIKHAVIRVEKTIGASPSRDRFRSDRIFENE